MAKRFYLSTRIDRAEQAAALLRALEAEGWERTFAWETQHAGTDAHPEVAMAELAGVRGADIVIVLLPGGRGTHVEIGAALAYGKVVKHRLRAFVRRVMIRGKSLSRQ
jgi:nucleoside 2-deoxyribosyltransferase